MEDTADGSDEPNATLKASTRPAFHVAALATAAAKLGLDEDGQEALRVVVESAYALGYRAGVNSVANSSLVPFVSPKADKETHEDFEKRTWRERMHVTGDGYARWSGQQSLPTEESSD